MTGVICLAAASDWWMSFIYPPGFVLSFLGHLQISCLSNALSNLRWPGMIMSCLEPIGSKSASCVDLVTESSN